MTCTAVEKSVSHRLNRAAIGRGITYADGVSNIVCNYRSCRWLTLQNRGCVYGNLLRRETSARCYHRIHLKHGGRIADGVIDTIQDIDYPRNLGDSVGYLGSFVVQL